jgi:uncharacterized low-complexity protein
LRRLLRVITTVEINMSNKVVKSLTVAIGAALLGSVTIASAASAFQVNDLGQGYMLVGEEKPEGKCGEGKCGADKGKEGSCGADKEKGKEGKCGEGKCGADKGKEGAEKGKEGSCGAEKGKEGSCGAEKGKEGSCGGSH